MIDFEPIPTFYTQLLATVAGDPPRWPPSRRSTAAP